MIPSSNQQQVSSIQAAPQPDPAQRPDGSSFSGGGRTPTVDSRSSQKSHHSLEQAAAKAQLVTVEEVFWMGSLNYF